MPHLAEEQISAYLDRQLGIDETGILEAHLGECESCQAVCGEMRQLNDLFHGAQRFEPSPFLWTRIAAEFDSQKRQSSKRRWGGSILAGLRHVAWSPGLAASVFAVLMIAGIAVYREVNTNIAARAALADIDRAFQDLATQDPDSYNPFSSGSSSSFDTNPFRSMRLKGRMQSARH